MEFKQWSQKMPKDEDIIEMLVDLFGYDRTTAINVFENSKLDPYKYDALLASYEIYETMKRLPDAKIELQKTRDLIKQRETNLNSAPKSAPRKPISQYNIN
jgi:hypothetical protein